MADIFPLKFDNKRSFRVNVQYFDYIILNQAFSYMYVTFYK